MLLGCLALAAAAGDRAGCYHLLNTRQGYSRHCTRAHISPTPHTHPQTARRFQKDPLLVDLVGEENTGKLADTITLMTMVVSGCAA